MPSKANCPPKANRVSDIEHPLKSAFHYLSSSYVFGTLLVCFRQVKYENNLKNNNTQQYG